VKTRLIVTLLLMLMNSPVLLAQQGKILSLDGFGDYVDVPDSGSLDILNQITVESWINFQEGGTDNQPRILSKGPDGAGYELLLTSNGASANLEFRIAPDSLISTTILNANVWYHVAATYDGSKIKLLINGTVESSKAASGNLSANTDALNIGQKSQPGFDSSIGFTDEVRVWNIARTQAEIRATMNTTLIGNEPGLVGYWNFDDGTANDGTANGNHGTLVDDARIIEYRAEFLDLAALTDVNGSSSADAAVLMATLATGNRVYVKDGVTGETISEAAILDDSWQVIDLAVTPGRSGALIGVLAQNEDKSISVAVHEARNGSPVQEIPFFSRNWVPSKLVYVPRADGAAGAAFGVLATNINDNRIAVQLRRTSDGSLIGTMNFFRDNWEAIDCDVLADISGNNRPELIVLGRSSIGQIRAIVKDASTQALLNKITYLTKTATPIGLAAIEDTGGGPAPELSVLGKRSGGTYAVENRDSLSDEQVNNISVFNSLWTALEIAGLNDTNGNVSPDLAVLAQHNTTRKIRAEVREAITGDLIRAMTFLSSGWDARAFAVFNDVNGNGTQEIGVVARHENGDVRVQIRDAGNGTVVKSMTIP
jgi:hypothetical protein